MGNIWTRYAERLGDKIMTFVSHYPLHNDASDVSGANDGTNNGVTFVTGGPIGQDTAEFDGSVDYIDIGSFSTFSSYSITMWVNIDTPGDGDNDRAISIQLNNDVLIRDSSGTWEFFQQASGASSYTTITGGTITADIWYHLVGTWNGSTMEFYVDSVSKGTASIGSMDTQGDEDTLGSYNNSSEFFDGNIADVRIYDHALSASEVAYLYQVSQGASYTSSTKML